MSAGSEVGAVIGQMIEALQLERADLRARLGPLGDQGRVRVVAGQRLIADPGAHTYRFACTLEIPVPEGTAVRLDAEGEATGGEVLRHDRDDETLVVVLKQDLGDKVAEGWVSFNPALLLELIAGRLRLIAESDADGGGPAATGPGFSPALGIDLLGGTAAPGAPLAVAGVGGSPAQQAAVAFALAQRVAYVWGPPGTGKTRALALLVHALRRRGEQVLIVAHTNVATDAALARVLEVEALPPGGGAAPGPLWRRAERPRGGAGRGGRARVAV